MRAFDRYTVRFRASGMLLCIMMSGAAGCQRELMPTPNLYAYGHDAAFENVPPAFRNNHVELLYATDRTPTRDNKVGATYGYGRSASLAFGSCDVEIGHDVSWDELARASGTAARRISLPLSVKCV